MREATEEEEVFEAAVAAAADKSSRSGRRGQFLEEKEGKEIFYPCLQTRRRERNGWRRDDDASFFLSPHSPSIYLSIHARRPWGPSVRPSVCETADGGSFHSAAPIFPFSSFAALELSMLSKPGIIEASGIFRPAVGLPNRGRGICVAGREKGEKGGRLFLFTCFLSK